MSAVRTPTDALILGTVVLATISTEDHPDHYGVKIATRSRFGKGTRAVVVNKTWHDDGRISIDLTYLVPGQEDLGRAVTRPMSPEVRWRQIPKVNPV